MKKFFMVTLVFGMALILWTPAIAKNEPGSLPAPTVFTAGIEGDSVCFHWDSVDGADKYSVDVDVDVDIDGDGVADMIVEFSFGTSDRIDGDDPSALFLCVPLADFVADLDEDGTLDLVSGAAKAKVKALKPGKGNGRQNNLFSIEADFILP